MRSRSGELNTHFEIRVDETIRTERARRAAPEEMSSMDDHIRGEIFWRERITMPFHAEPINPPCAIRNTRYTAEYPATIELLSITYVHRDIVDEEGHVTEGAEERLLCFSDESVSDESVSDESVGGGGGGSGGGGGGGGEWRGIFAEWLRDGGGGGGGQANVMQAPPMDRGQGRGGGGTKRGRDAVSEEVKALVTEMRNYRRDTAPATLALIARLSAMDCSICSVALTASAGSPAVPPDPDDPHNLKLVTLECHHMFHHSCIETWRKRDTGQRNRTCPLCRASNYPYLHADMKFKDSSMQLLLS